MINVYLNTVEKSYSADYRARLDLEIFVILPTRFLAKLEVLLEINNDDTGCAALQRSLDLLAVINAALK